MAHLRVENMLAVNLNSVIKKCQNHHCFTDVWFAYSCFTQNDFLSHHGEG